MTSVEPGVVDANILVYSVNVDDPYHVPSHTLLDAARRSGVSLYVPSQILCEFYSVVTNPRRAAVVSAPEEAVKQLSGLSCCLACTSRHPDASSHRFNGIAAAAACQRRGRV